MRFTKMQGIGNDYVYVNCFEETVADPAAVARFVSDRHFGIGSDGLILIGPSGTADCRMDMYNMDGSRGVMCGNGVRCVGKYAYDHGLVPGDRRSLTVETLAGVKTIEFTVEEENGRFTARLLTVDMGEARLTSELPEPINVDGRDYSFVGISVGNPHAVYFMDSIDDLRLDRIGPSFEMHPRFQPDRVNTEFIQLVDRNHIRMRVWERGNLGLRHRGHGQRCGCHSHGLHGGRGGGGAAGREAAHPPGPGERPPVYDRTCGGSFPRGY